MITFKEFLFEKKMSPTSYAATFKRLENDAKIGFEFEVFVPSGSHFHNDPDETQSTDKVELQNIKRFSQLQTYFKLSRQQEGEIQIDFGKWQTEREDEWVDANWEDFVTDDESRTSERDARNAALKEAGKKFVFANWVADEFGDDITKVISLYDLEPSFGWASDTAVLAKPPEQGTYMSGFKNTASMLANHLAVALKQRVVVNGTGYQYWNLTHDTSIKDADGKSDEEDQDGYGVEIVSPPLPPSEAMEQLAIVFETIDKHGIQTNESTGIHVNISLEDMEEFDPLKLVLFMGDEHILKKFDRQTNVFTLSQIKRVIDSISMTGKIPKTAPELIALGKAGLIETGKYFSVNLGHLPKYLEFRAAGGADYHKRLRDVREVTGRWLTAVDIAAHPDKYRREYLKKVMKLIDKTSEETEKSELKDISLEQMVLKFDGKMAWDTVQDALAGNDSDYKLRAIRGIFYILGNKLQKLEPTLANLKELRSIMKQAGVSAQQVISGVEGSQALRLSAVLKKFKFQAKPS